MGEEANAALARQRFEALLRWCKENHLPEIAQKLDAAAKRVLEIRRKFRDEEEEKKKREKKTNSPPPGIPPASIGRGRAAKRHMMPE